MYLKLWDLKIFFFVKTKDALNEWNMISIYYVMDFSKSQNYNYFKIPFKHKKFFEFFFRKLKKIFITFLIEIGIGKIC